MEITELLLFASKVNSGPKYESEVILQNQAAMIYEFEPSLTKTAF